MGGVMDRDWGGLTVVKSVGHASMGGKYALGSLYIHTRRPGDKCKSGLRSLHSQDFSPKVRTFARRAQASPIFNLQEGFIDDQVAQSRSAPSAGSRFSLGS